MIYFVDWCDDYERRMISYLKKMEHIGEISCISKRFNSINKRLIRYNIKNDWFVKCYIRFVYNKITPEDIFICKESLFFKYIEIIKNINCKKILLLRSSLTESRDVELDVVKKVFDSAYSFDKKDCQQTELNYLNQFFPFGFKEIDKITENVKCTPKSCFFLGKDKERIDIIENLATILKKHSCVISFYVVRDRTSLKNSEYYIDKNLSYEENIENALHSEILIEINREGQSGLTLRALEAIFFNKKLITNNQDIVQYDFYSPEQIFILGKDSFDDIGKFLDTEFTPVRKDILYQYSPDAMLETIIRNLSLLKNP